ncbi:c-Myc-binding protein homolog [Aethina tumida]|uniref:c-Myc-binding protein homolog n=1 Tax=Aethina tumida TaxID=116153 RepID=UPI00096B516A|nr:c-Myc-binding protein homolog [Aethina tumida]XP_019871025.1 c-Myc-binding protein homolog [Aethina tumida]XP_049821731.1 c-Myc-binding protein homolog [Aethina tumida]
MTTNQNFKPSEGKREEFRKYLEKNGVMDALTKVLVSLYEEVEKPEDALLFIRDKLAIQAGIETYDQQSEKIREMEGKITELEETIVQLKNAAAEAEATVAVVEEGAEPEMDPDFQISPPEGETEAEALPPPTESTEAPPE